MKGSTSLYGRHILGTEDFTREEIELVLDTARGMKDVIHRDIKKVPTLRGKSALTLFYEASTRTRTSFETAGKYLGADMVNITASASSVTKGESLRDTLLTVEQMGFDAIIMRHNCSGAAAFAAKVVDEWQNDRHPVIINAGDGAHAHPSQALLNLYTIRERKERLAGLKVAILGDILHSRVARSDLWAMSTMGMEVHIAGPRTLLPRFLPETVIVHDNVEDAIRDADVIEVLRIQLERMKSGLFPSRREYARIFGLNAARLALAKPNALVMHPGPMNRGLEIAVDVAYGEQSVIADEVQNGLAVRMALLTLVLIGGK